MGLYLNLHHYIFKANVQIVLMRISILWAICRTSKALYWVVIRDYIGVPSRLKILAHDPKSKSNSSFWVDPKNQGKQ